MRMLFYIVFFANVFCSIQLNEFFQSLIKNSEIIMQDKEIVSNYENCFAMILQYEVKKMKFENFQEWIDCNLNMLSIDETENYFYFEYLKLKAEKESFTDDFENKIEFPKIIFNENLDNLDKIDQKLNNIKLSDKLQKNDNEHFFFYSNFDALKDVPLLINEIFVLSKNLSPDHSVSIFVFKDLVFKDRLNNLKDYYEDPKNFIISYKITNQLIFLNNDSLNKKNMKAQNLIKTIDEFEKKEYRGQNKIKIIDEFEKKFKNDNKAFYIDEIIIVNNVKNYHEARFIDNLLFETYKPSEIELSFDEHKKFCQCFSNKFDVKNCIKLIIRIPTLNQIFLYDFYLISGKIKTNILKNLSDDINEYVLLNASHSYFGKFLFCFSNEEQIINKFFENGQFVSYDLLLNFANKMSDYFKKGINTNVIFKSYFSKQFFLINDYNYFESGKFQKFSIINITLYEIYQLLHSSEDIKDIEVSKFVYQIFERDQKSPEYFFIDLLENVVKTDKIENILNLYRNENFLLEYYNIKKKAKSYIYVLKKNHLKILNDFFKKPHKETKFEIEIKSNQNMDSLVEEKFYGFCIILKYTSLDTKSPHIQFILCEILNFYKDSKNFHFIEKIFNDIEKKYLIFNMIDKMKEDEIYDTIIKDLISHFESINKKKYTDAQYNDKIVLILPLYLKIIVKGICKSYKTFIKDKSILEFYCFGNKMMDHESANHIYDLLPIKNNCVLEKIEYKSR